MKKALFVATVGLFTLCFAFGLAMAEGLIMEGDEAALAALGFVADDSVGTEYVTNIALRNGSDTGVYSYIYRGYSYVVWATFSPAITGYPFKIKTVAKIKGAYSHTLNWNHVNTKTMRGSFIASGSAMACEPSGWVPYNSRVVVKVVRPGYFTGSRVFYTR